MAKKIKCYPSIVYRSLNYTHFQFRQYQYNWRTEQRNSIASQKNTCPAAHTHAIVKRSWNGFCELWF